VAKIAARGVQSGCDKYAKKIYRNNRGLYMNLFNFLKSKKPVRLSPELEADRRQLYKMIQEYESKENRTSSDLMELVYRAYLLGLDGSDTNVCPRS
jgi:hypothetical protein